MSWSFYAVGKPKAVLTKAEMEFERMAGYLVEPERSIAVQVHSVIKTAVGAMPDDTAIDIKAGGSQNTYVDGVTNAVSLDIKPIYGFVE